MFSLWTLIWVLLFVQLCAAPAWPWLFRKVIKKEFSRKILNKLAVAGSYLVILFLLIASLVVVGSEIGERSVAGNYDRTEIRTSADKYGFVDVRGQVHVHSYLSHDSSGTLEEIAAAARKNGVQWIILCDHVKRLPPGNYPDRVNGVLFIYGSERNGGESTSHLRVPMNGSSTLLNLHGHIESFGSRGKPEWGHWDAIELVNFHANALHNRISILFSIFVDPSDIYYNLLNPIPKNFQYWQALSEKERRPVPIFAGPDAHQNIGALGIRFDRYELMLGLVSTHVWLEEGKKLDQSAIFAAFKKGRTYIAFDCLGDPAGFQFCAKADGENFFTGDIAHNPWFFDVDLPDSVGDSSGVEIKFYRDNQLIATDKRDQYYNWEPKPGFWRVEIWKDGRLWIVSGQILVK